MSGSKVRLIHETNPEKYFPAIFNLASSGSIVLTGVHRYSVVKEWFRSWLIDKTSFTKRTVNSLNDLMFRLRIPFVRGETIVLGFAPWDWRILIYSRLVRNNKIVYHTSWHDWKLENTPRQYRPNIFQFYLCGRWKSFLKNPNVRIVAVTPNVAQAVFDFSGVKADVIPHSVPRVFFESRKKRKLGGDGRLNLLFVGEVSEKKGVNSLLSVYGQLGCERATLTVVGAGPLDKVVSESGEGVVYLGSLANREKLAEVMAGHDVLLLLSQRIQGWEELFGIVIVEALAAGCAVISSDHVGPKHILSPVGGVGLYREDDIEGVLDKLKDLLKDERECVRLWQSQDVSSSYHIDTISELWLLALS